MAKLTFNSVVYIKSTLEKVYVRAIITRGQSKKYKLSNGMLANREDIMDQLPGADPVPVPVADPMLVAEPMQATTPAPKPKSKPKKDR